MAAAQGIGTVTAAGAEAVRQPPPLDTCTHQVVADAGGVRVSCDTETALAFAAAHGLRIG